MATTKKAPAEEPTATKKKTGTQAKKSTDKADNYTDPALRERLKEGIMAGEKGGKAGEWSARKSQLLTRAYKKEGGGYKKDKKTTDQQHLSEWTEQDWTTSDGKPAEREGGTTRYLPKEAWNNLSEGEKKATNAKKVAGSKAGKQHVANTEKARKAQKDR